jgi:hypothetical protein
VDLSAYTHARLDTSTSLREDCKKLRALVLARLHAAPDMWDEADAIADELIALGHHLFDWCIGEGARHWTPDYMATNIRRHYGLSLKIDHLAPDGRLTVEVAFETRRQPSQRVR